MYFQDMSIIFELLLLRLEDLNHCIPSLIGQAFSTKKQRTRYQKAFTRRCHDLQTAEVEVRAN